MNLGTLMRWSWPLLLCSCAANYPVRTGYDRATGTWKPLRSTTRAVTQKAAGATGAGDSTEVKNRPAQDTEGREPTGTVLKGIASYYGKELAGNPTASGEIFDPSDHTCAHRTLPFGTKLKVTYPKKGTSTEVRVNDRGPHKPERILDISRAAADDLGLTADGIGPVEAEVLP